MAVGADLQLRRSIESRTLAVALLTLCAHILHMKGVGEVSQVAREGRRHDPLMTGGAALIASAVVAVVAIRRLQRHRRQTVTLSLLVSRVTSLTLESATHHVRPMMEQPPVDSVTRVSKTLVQIGKADGL